MGAGGVHRRLAGHLALLLLLLGAASLAAAQMER